MIELLVVVSILAILAGMLMPAISTVRASSQGAACKSKTKQIGLAMTAYSQDNEGYYPIDTNRLFASKLGGWSAQRYWQTDGTFVSFLEISVAPLMGSSALATWYRLIRDPANKDFTTSGLATTITGTTSAKYSDYIANRYMVGRSLGTASYPYSSMNIAGIAAIGNALLLTCASNSTIVTSGSYFTDIGDTTLANKFYRHSNSTANMLMADQHIETMTSAMVPTSPGIDVTDPSDPGRQFWGKYP